MIENKTEERGELSCTMSEEMMRLYSTLTETNKGKVTRLIETLLGQQSNGQRSSG